MLVVDRLVVLALFLTTCSLAEGAVFLASGRSYGGLGYPAGVYYYQVDSLTGRATRVSSFLNGQYVEGLAGASDGRLLGYSSGYLVQVNPATGAETPIGIFNNLALPGMDIANGSAYGVPDSGVDRRLRQINITTGAVISLGSEINPIGSALDVFFGDSPGVNRPAILGMGSVGSTLYGVHTVPGKNNLLAIDALTGSATVLGTPNAVALSGNPGSGTFSGFTAMTGIDEDHNGEYEAILGSVNAYDPDSGGPLAIERIGGVARYDLANGTWSLVGTNAGIEFYGFGAPIPEPTSSLVATCIGLRLTMRRRSRPW